MRIRNCFPINNVLQVKLRKKKKIQENEKQNNLKLLSLASAAELSGIPIDKVWDHFCLTQLHLPVKNQTPHE